MSVDGKRYERFEEETVYANPGETIRPQVKSYTGFKSPNQQSYVVSNSDGQSITYRYERNKYGLNLDLIVDGKENNGAGSGDLYVNNQLIAAGINDYYHNDANGPTTDYQYFYYDSVVEFRNIHPKPGYILTSPTIVSTRIGADTWGNFIRVNFDSSWNYIETEKKVGERGPGGFVTNEQFEWTVPSNMKPKELRCNCYVKNHDINPGTVATATARIKGWTGSSWTVIAKSNTHSAQGQDSSTSVNTYYTVPNVDNQYSKYKFECDGNSFKRRVQGYVSKYYSK